MTVQRHADHGPEVTCRPAGNGLCVPASPGDKLRPWREALAAQAKARRNRRGRRPPPPVTGVRAAQRQQGEQ